MLEATAVGVVLSQCRVFKMLNRFSNFLWYHPLNVYGNTINFIQHCYILKLGLLLMQRVELSF
jgi:hypothetical protein